jgi:hypothetical protein
MMTTNHSERCNLSLRLFNRRSTRKTLGYSKTLRNHKLAVALQVAHFNFCRPHSALKIEATETTPATANTSNGPRHHKSRLDGQRTAWRVLATSTIAEFSVQLQTETCLYIVFNGNCLTRGGIIGGNQAQSPGQGGRVSAGI